MSELNLKQQKFADEYIITGNATQSAIAAGYSSKTAEQTASRLLRNVKVSNYIKKRLEEIQDETILNQKEILVLLSEMAIGKLKDSVVVTTKKAEMIENPETGKFVKVYNEYPEIIETPTKNSDRNRALELLGRRYAMWTDKQEINGELGVVIVDDIDGE